jgi:hypothetical protein
MQGASHGGAPAVDDAASAGGVAADSAVVVEQLGRGRAQQWTVQATQGMTTADAKLAVKYACAAKDLWEIGQATSEPFPSWWEAGVSCCGVASPE